MRSRLRKAAVARAPEVALDLVRDFNLWLRNRPDLQAHTDLSRAISAGGGVVQAAAVNSKALVTIGVGSMAPVLDLALQTYRDYATRHGYDLVIGAGNAYGRPMSWARVPMMRKLLDAYEIVFWIDADAIILDPSIDIASYLEPDDYQALVQHAWQGDVYPNLGVWVIRGSRGRALLDAMWSETSFIDHEWWENGAFMHLMGYQLRPGRLLRESEWFPGTRWLSEEWNSHVMLNGIVQSRIRHYAGQSNPYREHRMQIDLAGLEYRLTAPLKIGMRTARLALSRERRQLG